MRKIFLIILTFIRLTAFTQSPLHSLLGADAAAYVCTSGTDTDAQRFIDSAGITNDTVKCALRQLVIDLKAYSIWTKFYALYPMVGGTANTCMWNLKNPVNADTAFRIIFVGGPASPPGADFTRTGWQRGFLGGAAYGNTNFTPSVNATNTDTSFSLSWYSRTNQAAGDIREMGAIMAAGKRTELVVRFTGDLERYRSGGVPISATGSVTDSRGFFVGSRINKNSISVYRNGTSLGTVTTTETSAPPTIKIYIGVVNNDGTDQFGTGKECAFASIGKGLTSTEVANFYTAVQAFETTLGRQM